MTAFKKIIAICLCLVLLIGTLASCDAGERGPQGEQGVRGEQGEQGIQGEKGDTGEKGEKGDDGLPGEKGEQGEAGEDGTDGITPLLQINPTTNMWEISLDNGENWESLGVKATGPQGEKGDTGATGETGAQGDKGDKGDDGITPRLRINSTTNMWEISYDDGLTWASLNVPATGAKGDKGDTGATGETGAQGPQGEKGDKGDTGATGAQGPQGEKGDKGDTGATGAQGPQGEKGDKGDTGATGAQGPQGEKGDKGDTGATGSTGANGITPQLRINSTTNMWEVSYDNGVTWASLNVLATGAKGDKGDAGATGAQGPQGEKGDKGDTGAQGPQGPQGEKGDKGDTGATGAQGPQGPQGEKGDKGDTGATGAQGPQGPQGEKGDKGDTGATGNGIESILKTSSDGLIDTYTVTFTDGSTATFTVTNGSQGAQGSQGSTGATIQKVEFDTQGRLVITLTDGTVLDPIEMPKEDVHEHTWSEWRDFEGNSSFSCDMKMYYRICSECGETQWKTVFEPNHKTIRSDGTCSGCGKYIPTEGVMYSLSDDQTYATVTGYTESNSHVVIAKEYQGVPVTSIGYATFSGCDSLTSVTIPNSVTSIGDEAFASCSSLTSITIPNSVTSIGSQAFQYCRNLTSVTIPNSVTSIGRYAFNSCSSLTSVEIPNSVTSIGEYAFEYCYSVTSVTIPNSVTSIGGAAFARCYKLVEVINHSSLNITAGSWDYGEVARYAIEVHSGTSKIVNVNDYLFYTYNNVNYLFGYVGADTALTLPENYNGQNYEINQYAFYSRDDLTSIEIPNSVTSIGDRAFSSCSSLTNMLVKEGNTKYHSAGNCIIETESKTLVVGCGNSVIPSDGSVTSIGKYAFYSCDSLTSITIPNSVTSIGDWAFSSCYSLTSITIPNSVTSIGSSAFYNCDSLTSVTIGNSVTSIGEWAFSNCFILTSIEIPNSVTSIGFYAFYNCSSLTSATFENTQGWMAGSTSISSSALANTSTAATYLKETYYSKNWSFIAPGLVFTFNESKQTYSVTGYTGNANAVVIPAVYENYPVTSIDTRAFYSRSRLESITIPNSVTSISSTAFQFCPNLTTITVSEGNTKYHSAGNCLIETATKTLILGCKNSVIPSDGSVTKIGSFAFNGSGLTSITIPNGVTSIGESAFKSCDSLTKIEIPASVTNISSPLFTYCDSLMTITIAEENPKYHSDGNCIIETATKTLVAGCKNSVIPSDGSVTSIGSCAFYGCPERTSLVIPATVTKIGQLAFSVSKLTSVTFENTEGWTAGSTSISSTELADPSTAATYLKSTYNDKTWTRS